MARSLRALACASMLLTGCQSPQEGAQGVGGQGPGGGQVGQAPGGGQGGQMPGGGQGGQMPGGGQGGQMPGGAQGGQMPGGGQGGQMPGGVQGGQVPGGGQGGQVPGGLQGGQFPMPGVSTPGSLRPGTPGVDRPPSGHDACLAGRWTMSQANVQAFLLAMVPIPGMQVQSGTLFVAFEAATYSYGTTALALRMEMGRGRSLEGNSQWATTGSWGTEDGYLYLTPTGGSSSNMSWTASSRGRRHTVPGPPVQIMLAAGKLAYTCAPGQLVLQNPGPRGNVVPMTFGR